MLAIIVGVDRVVIDKVKLKDWEKYHYYLNATQLYKMYPNHLMRIERTKYGHRIRSEEGQIWPENGVIPYHRGGMDYSMNKLISEIREHMLMVKNHRVQLRDLITRRHLSLSEFAKALPMLIVGAVLLWVML